MATYTCCTGQTECNHIITIGYLKSFIGTDIKNTGGTTVYVNTTKPDSYVPTYSELTGGTLVPQFVDGGGGRWHSNIDGITVKGTYASNQNVKQEDLVLTYTRYDSFSVSAGKTSLSECAGDSTSVCATYTLKKTVKQMNSSCTVTSSTSTSSDTTCKMSFSTCSWLDVTSCSNNCITVTTQKNGSWTANSRSCTVTASVTYKGVNYSDSVTLTQRALTGDYYSRNYKDRVYDSVSITNHSPQVYGCEGGEFSITAIGYYHDRYKWEDSCGVVYDQEPYSSVTGSEGAGSESGSFSEVWCPTESYTANTTLSIYYHGFSDSYTFYQDCTQSCVCNSETSCTRHCSATATAEMCGGDVTLSCTQVCDVSVYDWRDGQCVYISADTEDRPISTVVNIPENETDDPVTYTGTQDNIDYTITQAAGPCHGCQDPSSAITWHDVNDTAGYCDESITVYVPWTCVISYSNCRDEEGPTGTTPYTMTFSKNNTSSPVTHTATASGATITVVQAAGPCECINPTTSTTVHNATSSATACETSKEVQLSYEIITAYTNCPSVTSDTYYTTYTATFPANNTSSPTSHTFTTSGATVTINQAAGPCSCLDPETVYTLYNVTSSATACETSKGVEIPYTSVIKYSNCPDEPGPSGTLEYTATFGANNTSNPTSHTFSVSGITVTINQAAGPCSCLNPTTSTTFHNVASSATACETSKTVKVPYEIITAYTNCPSVTSETRYADYVATFPANNTSDPTSHTFSVSGITVTINQAAGPCSCLNPTTSITMHNVTSSATKCETSKIVQVPYEIVTAYTNCPSVTSSTYYASYTASFNKNNTSSPVSHTFTTSGITVTINQEAGPCECTGETSAFTTYNVTSSATACEESKIVQVPWACTIKYGNCPDVPGPTGTTPFTMTFGKNNTSSQRQIVSATTSGATVTINQAAGPCECLNPSQRTEWASYEIPCNSASTLTIVVPYSAITSYSNCPDVVTPGTSSITLTNISCNSGGTKVIRESNPRITQAGGCTCTTCSCNDFSANTADVKFDYVETGQTDQKTIAYSDEPCLNVTATATSEDYKATISVVSVANGLVTVSMTNNAFYYMPRTDTKVGTVTISATKDGVSCGSKVVDLYITGQCSDLVVNVGNLECSGGTTIISIIE